jgi:hypothetical protein
MDDQRDYAEERYNQGLCPACDTSPCIGEECESWWIDGGVTGYVNLSGSQLANGWDN